MDIYHQLGLSLIIHATGTQTRLGGTLMLPEVLDAMEQAASGNVLVEDLEAAASCVIAQRCGSEAGYVVSGAAAGLTLATAACMVRLDIAEMGRLPFPGPSTPNEVIIARAQRNAYDHAFRAAGATLVEVGMSDRHVGVGVRETELWEYEAALNERTAAIAYVAGPNAYPALEQLTALAHKHGVPVIVDAAGQLPPPANLRRFVAEGADLVVYSGGKALRGPQGTGFVVGTRDLVASMALQHLDMDVAFELWNPPPELIVKDRLPGIPRHGLGRGFKVSKEQIVGFIVALGAFTDERCQQDSQRWMELLRQLQQELKDCAKVAVTLLPPAVPLGFPLLELRFDQQALHATGADISMSLKQGAPPIYLGEKRVFEGVLTVHPINLDEQAVVTIARAIQGIVS